MQICEKELEDLIFNDLIENNGEGLMSRGLKTSYTELLSCERAGKSKWIRQVDLGPYGRADIIGYYRYKRVVVVEIFELKVVPIEAEDFDQICRYKEAIEHYFGGRFLIDIRLHLVGSAIKSGYYIHNNIRELSVSVFEYSLLGMTFSDHEGSWRRTDANSFNYLKSLRNAEAVHGYR